MLYLYPCINFNQPIENLGGGNCLFLAMSSVIYGSEINHESIRYRIVNYVINNWETEKISVQNVHDITDRQAYAKFMSISRGNCVTFGTEYEAIIFSRIFSKPIKILRKSREHETHYEQLLDNDLNNNNEQYIYFLHSGSPKDRTGHYRLLTEKPHLTTTQSTNYNIHFNEDNAQKPDVITNMTNLSLVDNNKQNVEKMLIKKTEPILKDCSVLIEKLDNLQISKLISKTINPIVSISKCTELKKKLRYAKKKYIYSKKN